MYQLLRTSPLLSGQLKWNLEINNNKVTDLQIVPISDYIPFSYKKRSDVLNYTHLENIKNLYSSIPSNFFSVSINPVLNNTQPIISDIKKDMHENTYELGLKRMEYHRYNKQFSFFCPMWIDEQNFDISKLEFRIVLSTILENAEQIIEDPENPGEEITIFADKENIMSDTKIDISKISSYLSEYINSIKLNNDLISLNFIQNQAWIKGIDVKNGIVRVQDTTYILNNITSRERPLLEFDNMILSMFSANNMIATQLFNFNFIFNIQDLIPKDIEQQLIGQKINAYVNVYYDGQKVQEKDLYTNYDFIPKYNIYNKSYMNEQNCLDYLGDYYASELIMKNKICPCTFHWALLSNPDYIFQLYPGFAPRYKDENNDIPNPGFYFDSPDIWNSAYVPSKNNLGWMDCFNNDNRNINIPSTNLLQEMYETSSFGYLYDPNKFNNDNNEYTWFQSLKIKKPILADVEHLFENTTDAQQMLKKKIKIGYGYIENSDSGTWLINDFKLIELYFDNDKNSNKLSGIRLNENDAIIENATNYVDIYIKNLNIDVDDSVYIYITFKNIFTDTNISNKILSQFVFRNIDSTLGDIYNKMSWDYKFQKNALLYLQIVCKNIVSPTFVFFKKSINGIEMNRPDISVPKQKALWNENIYLPNETQYIKIDKNFFSYVIRYDGKIYPYFKDGDVEEIEKVGLNNFIYYLKIYKNFNENEDIINYNKLTWTKFDPIYHSIKYYPYKVKKLNINKYYLNNENNNGNAEDEYLGDISWYKMNKITYLPANIQIVTEPLSSLNEDLIYEFFEKYCLDAFNIAEVDKNNVKYYLKNYAYPLYKYKYSFEYVDNKTIDEYIYKIDFILK